MAGETLICVNTDAGGGLAVMASETDALFPLALVVMVAVPADMPFASPVLSTVAALLELEKIKFTPDMALPCWSVAIA